jgi:excisionase family DNA binding protein
MAIMLTTAELADRIGVRPITVRAWVRRKKLNPVRLGKAFLWPVPMLPEILKVADKGLPWRKGRSHVS